MQRLFKISNTISQEKQPQQKVVLQEILLVQVSSRTYLEAAPGYSVAKTPEWKFWLVGTENMSVEMGLCARAMSVRKG